MMRLLSYVALFSALVLLTSPVLARSEGSNDCHFVPQEKPTEVVVEYTSKLRVELSQLPEVRIVGVLEDRNTGKQIPMVWDPLESPRLSYVVTVDPGVWIFSFRSDPLYRTAETSRLEGQDRFSITYRAVVPSKQSSNSRDPVNQTESTCEAEDSALSPKGWVHRETIRLQPFNLFDYNDRKNSSVNKDNAKDDILIRVYGKTIRNKSERDEDLGVYVVSAVRFLAYQGKSEASRDDVDRVIGTILKPICAEVESLTEQLPETENAVGSGNKQADLSKVMDLCRQTAMERWHFDYVLGYIDSSGGDEQKAKNCARSPLL